jgi:4'-phosphopantetheinyl transferase
VVWWAPLSAEQPWHGNLLDEGEYARRENLLRPADRSRLTLAAALLRLAVAAEVSPGQPGLAAASVRIDRRCPTCARPHGRPTLPDHPDLHVSVSHSGQRVAIAVTAAGPVGVDVEELSSVDIASLASHVLGPAERHKGPGSPDISPSEFFTYWTRKEAVLKATGAGLRLGLSDVQVSTPGQAPRLLSYPGELASEIQMADLYAGEDYRGALAVLSPDPITVIEQDGSQLLAHA